VDDSSRTRHALRSTTGTGAGDPDDQQEWRGMLEPISPELALIDPELAARARAALPDPGSFGMPVRRPRPAPSAAETAPAHTEAHRPYPIWARVTAALWLLVLGILIGGAAIPHAQDAPRVLPPAESTTTICKPEAQPQAPTLPGLGSPTRPGP
jgi:hypothetical protein